MLSNKVKMLAIVVLIFLAVYISPTFMSDFTPEDLVTLDDVSPVTIDAIRIESFLNNHMNEDVVVFVTPMYAGSNLTSHTEWIEDIIILQKKYNLTLGLHGCYHRMFGYECNEFLLPSHLKIKTAREEFRDAFGYYPEFFRAPCYSFNIFDYAYIRHLGMRNMGYYKHGKTYHPADLINDWDTLYPSAKNRIFN